jgi:hypothetical protein
MAPPA